MFSWICIPLSWLFLGIAQKHEPTEGFLKQKFGIALSPGILFWETNRFNSIINILGDYKFLDINFDINQQQFYENLHYFLDAYYVFGIVIFLVLQILLIILLVSGAITSIYRAMNASTMNEVADAAVLRPVVPGVNVASSDFPLVAFTLVVTLSFHELGHALAAATERVKTEGVGLFFALIMPGAFVRLEEGLLPQLPPRAQLKVYCAGAWHNIILALFSFVAAKSLPYLASPLYEEQPTYRRVHHGNHFKYHRDQNKEISSSLDHSLHHSHHHRMKHDGLALDLHPYSPFYNLLGKADDSLLALDDFFITSTTSMIDAIHKIDARATFATPISLFKLEEEGNDQGNHNDKDGNIDKQHKEEGEEVVQLQGMCVYPDEMANHALISQNNPASSSAPSSNECFIIGGNLLTHTHFQQFDSFEASQNTEILSTPLHHSSIPNTDKFFKICQKTTVMIEKAKSFAHQVYDDEDNVFSQDDVVSSVPCPHCRRQPLFTCSRSLDCPRIVIKPSSSTNHHTEKDRWFLNQKEEKEVKEEKEKEGVGVGGVGRIMSERGSCARALLSEGESLVSVHLSSGRSLAWRGDVVQDGLALALTPAVMRLRPYVSHLVRAIVMKMSSLWFSSSSPQQITTTNHQVSEHDNKDNNDSKKNNSSNDSIQWNGDSVIKWLIRAPATLLSFFSMLTQVSISIALLNILPIYYLDGHLASVQFIRLWLLSAPPPPPPPSSSSSSSSSTHKRTSSECRDIENDANPTSVRRQDITNGGGAISRSSSNGNSQSGTSSPYSPYALPYRSPPTSSQTSYQSNGGSGSHDDPEFEQLLRDRYHDWNALHMRQTRYTLYLLGSGSLLVLINLVLGGIALYSG